MVEEYVDCIKALEERAFEAYGALSLLLEILYDVDTRSL